MRPFLTILLLAVTATTTAQTGSTGDNPVPGGKDSRKAYIKSALGSDHGEITAMEASGGANGGVFIGYSSGALLHCYGERACRKLEPTPVSAANNAVRHIAVSRRGNSEVIWAVYPHGMIYQCIDYRCREFDSSGAQQ